MARCVASLLVALGLVGTFACPGAAQTDPLVDDGVDDGVDDVDTTAATDGDLTTGNGTHLDAELGVRDSGRLSDEQALAEDEDAETVRASTDPFEEEHTPYYFLGAFYRHNWTPNFMQSLFLDESTAANNPALGLEFTYRKDSFEIITSIWYQRYATEGPYRGKGDTITETEFIDANLSTVFVGAAFLWSTMFTDWIGLEYGLDIGVGGVVGGELKRDEAFQSSGAGSVDGWAACPGPVAGDGGYCEPGGNYGIEESWFKGGSRPALWARLAPHLAVRIKPIHQVVFRIDTGFDVFSGFFLGAAAAFGF